MGSPPPEAAADRRPDRLELAEIFRAHGARYRQTHVLTRVQRAAMRAIEACRTAVLGGHRETCDRCGVVRVSYNSCLMVSARFWEAKGWTGVSHDAARPFRLSITVEP